jgi:hypothetical protein
VFVYPGRPEFSDADRSGLRADAELFRRTLPMYYSRYEFAGLFDIECLVGGRQIVGVIAAAVVDVGGALIPTYSVTLSIDQTYLKFRITSTDPAEEIEPLVQALVQKLVRL